ncbi:MAG: DUF6268 family outer membrane beta-barrel protein [Bacteroidota bacterium]
MYLIKGLQFSLAILLLLVADKGFAQKKYTIASVGYMGSYNIKYADPDISSDCGYLSLNLSLPIVINKKTAIVTGIRANNWTVNYEPEQIWPTSFYSLGLTLGVNHKFSDKNTLLFVVLPKMNSDYKTINNNAFQLGFLSTYSIRKNENFLWKVGMYYNEETYGSFVVPIFGLDWDVNNKLNIKGDLPIHGKVNYELNEGFSSGLGYVALVSSYRLSEFNDSYTSRFAIEPFLYADVKLFKNTYFNVKAGYTMSRNYPIYEKDDKIDWQLSFMKFGDDREQLNPVIMNGAFVEFGLAYKIDIVED